VKVIFASAVLALAGGLLWGTPAKAQVRVGGAVRIAAPRARAAVIVGGYGRPRYSAFYDPFYFNAFYGPYFYRPFYFAPQIAYGPIIYGSGASLRLQVSPRPTEVYIDGYYAGTVDDFDGIFQRLHIEPGSHDVTLYLDGYRTVHQRIYLQPTGAFRLRYMMQRLGTGEVAEPRPVEPPPAPPVGPPQGAFEGYPPPPPAGGPPPRPPGPPAPGNRADVAALSIRVQPAGAEIFVDGERWDGPSDDARLIVQVSPGRHHLEVRRDGYRTYATDVDVRPGDTAPLNISLSRQ